MAEVELSDPNETFEKPDWAGKEVTKDIGYSNYQIAVNGFPK